jgi:hypothetical protein
VQNTSTLVKAGVVVASTNVESVSHVATVFVQQVIRWISSKQGSCVDLKRNAAIQFLIMALCHSFRDGSLVSPHKHTRAIISCVCVKKKGINRSPPPTLLRLPNQTLTRLDSLRPLRPAAIV